MGSSEPALPKVSEEAAALRSSVVAEKAMMERLADRLAADAAGSALVLIGWSMGGMLAAELALMLQARGCPPQMLHVAGRMAPGSFIAAGDDVDKYLLASDEMKATEAWREWLLPMLMADLRADARAEQRVAAAWSDAVSREGYGGAAPLSCLLQVCAGHEDAAFPPDAVQAWRPLTSGRFESHVLAGGHDILQRGAVELLRLISRALLPAFPLYGVEWRPIDSGAGSIGGGGGGGGGGIAMLGDMLTVGGGGKDANRLADRDATASTSLERRLATSPLTWRTLSGNAPHPRAEAGEEEAPREFAQLRAPSPAGGLTANVSVASFASFASAQSQAEGASGDDEAKGGEAHDTAVGASAVEAADATAEAVALDNALSSPLGLVLYVPAREDVSEQEAQCWHLIHLVQGFVRRGASGRVVLVLPVAATSGALVVGASKVVSLESPELSVQRVYVPESVDVFRFGGGAMAAIDFVATGWLRWAASIAARHTNELDLWVNPTAPHSLCAPRLTPRLELPPSSAPAVDPNGVYLITGGTGGVGGALVAWLLYEQGVPPPNIVLISRRVIQHPPHDPNLRCVSADISSADSLRGCADLTALPNVSGIFHLAGVLDDGLLTNMTPARLHTAVQPKAGVLSLLELCAERRWAPRWLVAASSTSSLLGYAGQANYCAANGLLDHLATFGLPSAAASTLGAPALGGGGAVAGSSSSFSPPPPPPRVLTLNFGPWGEVGMAREGTKAHQLSLQSGELPMASSAAIGCIAEALRQLRASTAAYELGGELAPPRTLPQSAPFASGGMQFAVADVEWWRSPWPSHPLLQGVMHRLPTSTGEEDDDEDDDEEGLATASKWAADKKRKKKADAGAGAKDSKSDGEAGQGGGDGGGGDGTPRVEEFLKGRLSVWQPALPLAELGLDSLDLVSLRNAFQKKFKLNVPMATFTNAQQTLGELIVKLGAKF